MNPDPTLPLVDQQKIDQLCDRFEQQWQQGELPRIETVVVESGLAHQEVLLRELIRMEVELRYRAGESPQLAEYQQRFAEHHQLVEVAFQEGTNLGAAKSVADTASPMDHGDSTEDLAAEKAKRGAPTLRHTGSAQAATPNRSSGESRFQVLRPHARGGLGEVFLAQDLELSREVALKEIQSRYADDPASRTRFLVEAEITGGLEHPGIVPVYGLGRYADGRPYYAMRFIKGDSLQEAADRFHGKDKENKSDDHKVDFAGVEFRKLLGRFVDVCQAIEYAHSRGVLHRDLKPGNIMLGKFGETLVVDWGLAKTNVVGTKASEARDSVLLPASASGDDATMQGTALGTPAYMPPEQAAGRIDQLSPASDVYSLGATLYYLLTGAAPFQGKRANEILRRVQAGNFLQPQQVHSHVPQALQAICLKAMSLAPSDRYGSPQQVADEVERWLADEPVSALSEPVSVRARRWMRKHPKLIGSLAASFVLGLVSTLMIAGLIAAGNRALTMKNGQLTKANAEIMAKSQLLAIANEAEKNSRKDAETRERKPRRFSSFSPIEFWRQLVHNQSMEDLVS